MSLRFLYNILINIAWLGLKVIALFNAKIKLFVQGRQKAFPLLKEQLPLNSKTVWMHVASLGEFEQGLPILERLRSKYPEHKLVLSFFSPSGYEVKKNSSVADLVVYLPMDSNYKAKRFLNLVNPELAIFVKYEVWPNYLYHLKKGAFPLFWYRLFFPVGRFILSLMVDLCERASGNSTIISFKMKTPKSCWNPSDLQISVLVGILVWTEFQKFWNATINWNSWTVSKTTNCAW